MNPSSPLTGQVAVITGATGGIGSAVARAFHQLGLRLVLTGRSADTLVPLGEELGSPILTGDISDPALPTQLLALALTSHGRCDILLNNAGLIEVAPIETIDIEKVCTMVRVNVEAAYRVAYTFLKHFRHAGEGHLLNVSSVLGTKVRPTAGAYAGTKFALEALSEALRMEVAGSRIAVTTIEPGLVKTGLHRDWPVHPTESMNIREPLQPADIARTIAFILQQPAHVRIPRIMILPSEHQI